jgi:hypothetical protein
VRAFRRECLGRGLADTARRPGDQRDLVDEIHLSSPFLACVIHFDSEKMDQQIQNLG